MSSGPGTLLGLQGSKHRCDWEASKARTLPSFLVEPYLHLLGILLYLTKTRPEISTAVSFAATKASHPTQGDYEELLHCVQYLYNTRDKCLTFIKGVPNRKLILKCYVCWEYGLSSLLMLSHTLY